MPRTYVITGASSGFGRALAQIVLERGDRAVLGARRLDALRDVARDFPQTALAVALDVTDAASRTEAVAAALRRFEHIDVLANIAGRGSLGAAEEFSPEQLREQMDLNFFAAVELTRIILPHMRTRRSGHIVNLTSIGGIASVGGFSAYCASKFALEGWSEALRDEVAPLGLRVTIVEPGAFRTEFAGDANVRPQRHIDDYRQTIAPIEAYLYGNGGKQPGDPRKAAEAIIAAIESPAPPLRLMLGSDALGLWEKKRATVDEDVARWRSIAEATAYEGADVTSIGG